MSREHLPHDSAVRHVTGESVYINDMEFGPAMLKGKIVFSRKAHAKLKKIDISEALKIDGIAAVLLAKDIPGANQMGPVVHDEPCLADGLVTFIGQAIALIAGETDEALLAAENAISIEYEDLEPVLSLEQAIESDTLLAPPREFILGDAANALKNAPHNMEGILKTGAQEHWYLETQSALAEPREGKEMMVYASSQNPAETQAIVAEVLGLSKNEVEVEVKRMGGGFGGKETQGNHVAAWAALLANVTRRPVRIHLFRDDDQLMTGKRHRFLSKYQIGFDDEGKILAYIAELNADGGSATDLSMAILERSMFHAENAYFIPDIHITGRAWKTNLPSNTAFRGFGGPQGMAVIENAIDRIARFLKKDPAEIRKINYYGDAPANLTPYGQTVENNRLAVMHERILQSSDYAQRRKEIDNFNREHEFYKKGIALTPVKFGISFTTSFLNQAGALVNIYTDGTVLVNHGGTEMGQGLHTKIQGVAATLLGLSPGRIKVNATNTAKIPNTSATAASSGSDINGMAVKNAIETIKERLIPVAAEMLRLKFPEAQPDPERLVFRDNAVADPAHPKVTVSFDELVKTAYLKQVSLSSTGFYRTPGIHFDKTKMKGKPFYYYSYGFAVSEVMIDVLTGQHRLLRTDILQDVGDSLNAAIDRGQVEGAFVQGLGWVTTEEVKWDSSGRQLTHSPDTYKIPTVADIPADFRVELMKNVPNPGTILRSKAIGEPPFMLAFSVWLAIKDAISAVGNHLSEPEFALPATYEVILLSSEKLKTL